MLPLSDNFELTIFPRSITAGLDSTEMDESLCEVQYEDETDYNPMSKGNIELE